MESCDYISLYRVFANDFEDLGGGYIIVGVDTDKNGVAKRPVAGVPEEQIDVVVFPDYNSCS